MFMNLISMVKSSIKDIPNQKYRIENSFYLKEEGIHHFFCVCGHHDVVSDVKIENPYVDTLKFNRDEIEFTSIPDVYHPDNSCLACGNERYLDMDALLFNHKTLFWTDVDWSYREVECRHSWKLVSVMSVPRFDYDKQKIVIEELKLSSYFVSYSGESYYYENHKEFLKKQLIKDGKYYRINKILKDNMAIEMVNFMIKTSSQSLVWLNGEERELKNLLFFLKNSNIRFKDVLSWKDRDFFLYALNQYQYLEPFLKYILNHRKEKSLRKAQFISYKKMMSIGGYSPMADYIFSQTIDDVNHLLKVLNMDVEIKRKLFDDCLFQNIDYFIGFLKRQYEEKHIVRFWLSISDDDLSYFLLRDTTDLFYNKNIREELDREFQKTALNIRAIHHELTKYSRGVKRANQVLDYSDFIYSTQVSKENMDYILPHSSEILHEWGKILHNCLFYYFDKIMMEKITVFGVFMDGNLTYALEIDNHEIIQASSAYNQPITPLDREKIEKWYKEIYMKKLREFSD